MAQIAREEIAAGKAFFSGIVDEMKNYANTEYHPVSE